MARSPAELNSFLDQANHTGRELELMLAGKKPLAWFTEVIRDGRRYEEVPEVEFDVHVRSGSFVKDAFRLDPIPEISVRHVLYALAGEAWRLPAMRLALHELSRMSRIDEGMDRVMGALLGYTAEEIDAHVAAGKAARLYAVP